MKNIQNDVIENKNIPPNNIKIYLDEKTSFSERSGFYKFFFLLFLIIALLAFIFLFTFFYRSFVYDVYHVPSDSMYPNIPDNHFVLVSKYAWGYSNYSLTTPMKLFNDRISYKQPERGDIAVFRLANDINTYYVKRIIGLPGDGIYIDDDMFYISGTQIEHESNDEQILKTYEKEKITLLKVEETLPEGKRYCIAKAKEQLENKGEKELLFFVPKDFFLVLGDNRDFSIDSRHKEKVGYVHKQLLMGLVEKVSPRHISFYTPWLWNKEKEPDVCKLPPVSPLLSDEQKAAL